MTGPTRCGTVAILGAPNAGKSTLVNTLVGAKVSIVSPKVQTTRSRVLAIQVKGDVQLIYIDTPGIFAPRRRLDRAMVAAAWGGAADADALVLLIDSVSGMTDEVRAILDQLRARGRTAALALNKVDIARREALLTLAAELDATGLFTRVFMISGLNGSGVADLETWLAARLPEGPFLYPEDQLADMPERLLAAELTREQLYLQLHDELPYKATVETERWEEFDDGSVKVNQIIYVARDTHKAIVLGKAGRQIKRIGERARAELETAFDRRVHLILFVKVRADWEEDPERYRAAGLEFDA